MTEYTPYATPAPAAEPERERVLLGLLASLLAVVGGVVLTVLIWRAGYVAAFTSFIIAIGAVWLYSLAAGRPPKRGLIPLVAIILVGVVLSFFAVVASDLMEVYDNALASGLTSTVSKSEFVRRGLTDTEVLSDYGKDMALFALFAALGIFSTMRRLVARR